jgi:hypothetical protein
VCCEGKEFYILEECFCSRALLKYEDKKVADYSSMVIYNILLGCPEISSVTESCEEFLEILIDRAMEDSEFA